MHQSGKAIGLWSAVALGMGAMVGAGIFALLGQASTVAGNAVFLSFIAGGGVALLSGYSLAKLGSRYPAAGGIVEYLVQSFGEGYFSGVISIVMYISALVALALIARTFGSYAALFLQSDYQSIATPVFAGSVLLLFAWINYEGAQNVARLENLIVLIKFVVLLLFSVVSLWFIEPSRLSTDNYPGINPILSSIAVTFFAYEGFRVITNTAEDMENPARTLPRAMFVSILLVMFLYVIVAIAVFGNLPIETVIQAKDYALAEAARPVFGSTGFMIVAMAALISTASAINANLYAVTNVSYQMAKDGELPREFAKPIGHSKEGLLVSTAIIIPLAVFFDLSEIATLGSITILVVHAIVHLGHLRQCKITGASQFIVLLAFIATIVTIAFAGYYALKNTPYMVLVIGVFFGIAIAAEVILRLSTGRIVKTRSE